MGGGFTGNSCDYLCRFVDLTRIRVCRLSSKTGFVLISDVSVSLKRAVEMRILIGAGRKRVARMERDTQEVSRLLELSADIVSAYVSNHQVPASDLPGLIESVHGALASVLAPAPPAEKSDLRPAVPVRRSVTDEHIVCLEDGKKFKSLKRHLRTRYDMSPEAYREKWGLPSDYPMVAPNYARQRSELARKMGLGQGRK